MMYIFTSVLNYIKIYRKINTIIKSTNYSIEGLNNINESYIIELYDTIIKQNGCVCIKFFQWLLPIIETYYCKDNKPVWFKLY